MSPLHIVDHPDGATLQVRVKPRASRTALVGTQEGDLVVALAAPPVDGQANAALLKALAKWCQMAPRGLVLQTGAKSKHKVVKFPGLSADELRARLSPHLPTETSA
ncbi:MAG: DUF167 family protein [Polyangiaceae bacterium]